MKTYEINDTTVCVPQDWHEVMIDRYDAAWSMKQETARQRAESVAAICGVDFGVLLAADVGVFNLILQDVDFLFQKNPAQPLPVVDVDGVKYVVATEDRLTFGEYIDVDAVQKEGVKVLSNVLAIVCRPVGETYDPHNNEARAKMFGEMPVAKVQGVLAFFLQCYQISIQLTRRYASLQATANQLPRSINPFRLRGGFIKWLRIWPIIKYYILMRLLRARLRRFSHSFYINGIGAPQN